ncbi:hypothetical protein O7606_01645 [Micromonospora sp. WMMD882]|uniref:hypothetical protein n=1 Tax=Micromonospora sp. WMMD882 TaxID=3015151 RepID=UPI00248D0341|nr:hypothetical protein [Micromonospora sp. WMMD882]WBB80124.1 hypothetical protein O7606_01645 [Micromonospora sp. WMMD882]
MLHRELVFKTRVLDDDKDGPKRPDETVPARPDRQPARRGGKEPAMQALATAFDLAAVALEADGNGGLADAARATALLLRLIATLGRSNDQG